MHLNHLLSLSKSKLTPVPLPLKYRSLTTIGMVRRTISRFQPSPTGTTAGAKLLFATAHASEVQAQQVEPKARPNSDLKTFQICRWNSPSKPELQDYQIDLKECGPMVFDALIKINNEVDPTLTFLRSCGEGICDSHAMNIDGCNGLACLTKISSGSATIVTPLPHIFVIKDLVVDMTNFYNQYKSIEPPQSDGKEVYQSKKDLDGMYECILLICHLLIYEFTFRKILGNPGKERPNINPRLPSTYL